METTLLKIDEFDRDEWISDFELTPEQYTKLRKAYKDRQPVKVEMLTVEAADEPQDCYFDIKLADGTKIGDIAGYHLKDIHKWDMK